MKKPLRPRCKCGSISFNRHLEKVDVHKAKFTWEPKEGAFGFGHWSVTPGKRVVLYEHEDGGECWLVCAKCGERYNDDDPERMVLFD